MPRFNPIRGLVIVAALAAPAGMSAQVASETPDVDAYRRIREEGLTRSQVMVLASELVDGIGPRLTGSPNLARAVVWSQARLRKIGLTDVRTDSWGVFGIGWRQRNAWLRMVEPDTAPFIVHAAPWSPATPGTITGEIVAVRGFSNDAQFEPHKGKLRGKIVLLGRAVGPPDAFPIDRPLADRLSEAQLAELAKPDAVARDEPNVEQMFEAVEFLERSCRLLATEGVRAVLIPSGNNARGGVSGGTIYADNNAICGLRSYEEAHAIPLPFGILSIEHYGRMKRLLDRGVPVRVELNLDTEVTGKNVEGLNVLADLAGVDPAHRNEIVMATAHLDSWAAGTGATDDGAGVVIVMEAMRILRALDLKPRRTIRIALFTGEEQGALGSLRYVNRQVAALPRATTPAQLRIPEFMRARAGAPIPGPEHARLSAVFNLDAGGGKIRGVSVGSNALVPIFQRWVAPLADLGMTMVGPREDCGGDCRPFMDAGIPTPSFKQDPLEYDTRTHHTNMDTYERLVAADLQQAAVVVATMLYNTAMRDELLPRGRSEPNGSQYVHPGLTVWSRLAASIAR
jgi:carboxypeptidase Q